MARPALAAAEALAAEGFDVAAVNARFIKPLDEAMLERLVVNCSLLVTVEEGTVTNGFGAYLAAHLQRHHPEARVLALGVADELVMQAPRADQLEHYGLTSHGIAASVRATMRLTPVS